MTYNLIRPYLLEIGLGETRPLAPPSTPPPRGYDSNVICDFHAGSLGHTTENFMALKFKVQDLLNQKVIYFTTENTNVKNNSMSGHEGPTINAIKELEDNILI